MMTPLQKYYSLYDDMGTDERWYLDDPAGPSGEWIGTALTRATRYEGLTPLTCRVHHPGPPLELTISLYNVPVVTDRVAELLLQHARDEIQLLPTEAAGYSGRLWAVNILSAPDCVDEVRSEEVRRWTEADGRPDRIGDYREIYGLQIDPVRATGSMILRPKGWLLEIIVAEPLATALTQAGVRCQLTSVTGP
jgi:hypothetical protein